jgi:hypothetical protein
MAEIFYLPGEAMFLTFKTVNGSGWLTSHRLILCEHPPGQLEGYEPDEYWLKNFKQAQIEDSTLTARFQNKKAIIRLPLFAPSLLQDIKSYIEESAKNWQTKQSHSNG